MLEDPKAKSLHQSFIKKFGQRVYIDYLNTEDVVNFFLHSSDEYDRQVLQNRLDRYNANQR